MRIDPKEKIAEISILEVRKLLKSVDNESEWGKNLVTSLLQISPAKAHKLLIEIEHKGYIERSAIIKKEQFWRKTLKGSAIGLASAAKPVTRKTADRVFSDFMERVKKVNSDTRFLMKVKKVVVFGSYLGDSPTLNDIDIAIELIWKENHPRFVGKDKAQAILEYADEAQTEGRRFATFIERITWPEDEVKLYLKSRSRTLSLHSISDKILDLVEYKVVYSEQ